MTNDNDQPGAARAQLMAEARRWAARLRAGEVSRTDVDAFERWRAESPAHRRAFAEVNVQWDVLRSVARNMAAAQPPVAASGASRRGSSLSRRAWLGGAIAASAGGVAYLAARPPLDLWPSLSELSASYRTDVGERRTITFADTVAVALNTRTSLAAADPRARQVELIAGEIAVDTGIDAAAPADAFVVVAGGGRVSAARAKFSLRYDGQAVSVTCLDGAVQVECRHEVITLKPRQQVAYDARGLDRVAATDGRAVEGWQHGLLVFENRALAEVIPEINRYRRGRIVLLNDNIGRLVLDATFRIDRIEDAVAKIADIFALKTRVLPGGLVLLS
ncbi:FecR family protein [Bradyrhizobium sp. 2TAF24]|uniref:FecR family protein n=1 Tax=Bradyrhizobium sp. 2TAF24 TaxID=3233011 RepID=UPI003F9137F5